MTILRLTFTYLTHIQRNTRCFNLSLPLSSLCIQPHHTILSINLSGHSVAGTPMMTSFYSLFLFGAAASHCLLHNTGAKLHSCMHPKQWQSLHTHKNTHCMAANPCPTLPPQSASKSLFKTFSEVHGLF